MAVTVVGATSAETAAVGALSVSVTIHASAAVGDLALIVASNERGSQAPVITGPTAGYATGYAISSSNIAGEFGWKRLTAGDLTNDFTATVTPSIRRSAIGVIVLRGADDPVFTTGALVSSATAHTTPTVASVVAANSLLVGLTAFCVTVAPYTRTFTPSGGWTEVADLVTDNAGGNAGVIIDHKILSGGAGSSQVGVTNTPSDTTSNVVSYRATVEVGPAVNVAPTVTVNADQVVAAAATVNFTSTATDTDGTIAARLWAHTYPASGGPSITGSTTASASITAGSAGALYVTGMTATDNDGATGFDSTETAVPLTTEVNPLTGYGGIGVAVTKVGSSTNEETTLGTGTIGSPDDTKYIEFPNATGVAQARRWRYEPSVQLADGVVTHRLGTSTGTMSITARLYQSTTLKATWSIPGVNATPANYPTTLTNTQALTISDWTKLWIEYEEV